MTLFILEKRCLASLIGIKFVIMTDCQALVYVNPLKTKNPQIIRWLSSRFEFDSEIRHRKGERMQHVDDSGSSWGAYRIIRNREYFECSCSRRRNVNVPTQQWKLCTKDQNFRKAGTRTFQTGKGEISAFILQKGILYKLDETNNKELHIVLERCAKHWWLRITIWLATSGSTRKLRELGIRIEDLRLCLYYSKSFITEMVLSTHWFNSSRHAQINGQVERLNQTLSPALQTRLGQGGGLKLGYRAI